MKAARDFFVKYLIGQLRADGYDVISGPRTAGDGYCESCIVGVEDNQIELTVSRISPSKEHRHEQNQRTHPQQPTALQAGTGAEFYL